MLNGIGSSIPSVATTLTSTPSSDSGAGGSFGDVFKSAIQGVNELQTNADMKISDLLHGAPNADVSDVMVSVEKADVAFQLMMQVRNKIVSAYQDIEKMQF